MPLLIMATKPNPEGGDFKFDLGSLVIAALVSITLLFAVTGCSGKSQSYSDGYNAVTQDSFAPVVTNGLDAYCEDLWDLGVSNGYYSGDNQSEFVVGCTDALVAEGN